MADVKTTIISNREATPRVANDPWNKAVVKSSGVGILEVSTAEDATDILYFVEIPSNAVVRQVLLSCDAVSTSGAIDIGLYQTTDNGGAVVDADLFASAQVVTTALNNSDVTHESGEYNRDEKNKPIWEVLGLTEDPQIDYWVAGTITTDMGGAGTISLEVLYVDGGA